MNQENLKQYFLVFIFEKINLLTIVRYTDFIVRLFYKDNKLFAYFSKALNTKGNVP